MVCLCVRVQLTNFDVDRNLLFSQLDIYNFDLYFLNFRIK